MSKETGCGGHGPELGQLSTPRTGTLGGQSSGATPLQITPRPAATDVLDWPLVFTQRKLHARRSFIDHARGRGVDVDDQALDVLDRHGILSPFFRVRRSLMGVRSAIRSAPTGMRPAYPGWTFADDAAGLRLDHERGLLRSGLDSPPTPKASFWRQIEGVSVQVRDALYSPYQLLDLNDATALVPDLVASRRRVSSRSRIAVARARARRATDRSVLLTVLEARYYPRVTGNLTMPAHVGLDAWYAADRQFDAKAVFEWSGWTPDELREEAERLLFMAWSIDPLRDWVDLVRHVGSWRWKKLRGAALHAVELRIAAEMLLRFHEALHRAKAGPALPEPHPRSRSALDDRLKADPRELDPILAKYGLSPHPAVLFIAEGETEMALLPLVMDELGVRRRDTYIKIINARTERRDHSLLVRYAALPRLGPVEAGAAEFLRPPTRYLITVDGDQTYRTQVARDAERDKRVDELMQDLDAVYRTAAARDDLRSLVLVEAWADGLDFERANFTDSELARGIVATGCAPAGTTIAQVEAALTAQRRDALAGHARNIKAIWRGWPCEPSKPALALHLWPTLRARIRRQRSRAGLDRIPVARILLLARDLADGPRDHLLLRI